MQGCGGGNSIWHRQVRSNADRRVELPCGHEVGVCGGGADLAGGVGGGVGVVPAGLEKELELAVHDGLADGGFQADLRQPGRFGFSEVLAVEVPNPGTPYAFRLKAQRRTPGGTTRSGGKAERIAGGEPVGR